MHTKQQHIHNYNYALTQPRTHQSVSLTLKKGYRGYPILLLLLSNVLVARLKYIYCLLYFIYPDYFVSNFSAPFFPFKHFLHSIHSLYTQLKSKITSYRDTFEASFSVYSTLRRKRWPRMSAAAGTGRFEGGSVSLFFPLFFPCFLFCFVFNPLNNKK